METVEREKMEYIFHAALEIPSAERKNYLVRECAGNAVLLSEVEELIESFEKDAYFLEENALEFGFGAIHETNKDKLKNKKIGFYRVEEKIGEGGMGDVYKAVDTRLNRRVALKFLSASLENDKSAHRQLMREAQASAALDHPNICAVHGFEEIDGHNFIVMQFIEGKTLDEALKDRELSVEEFKLIAKQIISAVAFAHSHSIIHRDLKPGNIMLTNDGQIKVLDFGLAKILHQKSLLNGENVNNSHFSHNGLIIGTVAYMSPEQLRGEKIDFRSDIFSVGIVLCELLIKQNPFKQKSQAETIAAILHRNLSDIEISTATPSGIKNLFEKCLHKKPDERFQSAAEMLVELDKNESRKMVDVRSMRGQGLWVKLISAVTLILLIFTFVYFYGNNRPQPTLAVMPITFDSSENEKEYLADGLTRGIIEKLSSLSNLKIKNIDLVKSYKGKNLLPQVAAKELKADAVFVGSIINRDNLLMLSTKLIRTIDGEVVYSEDFLIDESKLTDLQESLSQKLAIKLKTELSDEDKNKLALKDTKNEEAKRLYFLGRFYLNRKDSGDIKNALRTFTETTNLDPLFAKAWAGLAEAYLATSLPGAEKAMPPSEAANSAKFAAQRALELDDTLSESYNSLGMIALKYDWNWEEAEKKFREAISRDPEFISARIGLINVFSVTGRFEDSIAEAFKLKEIDPLSMSSDLEIAKVFYRKSDFQQMDKILTELLDRYPNNDRIAYIQCYKLLKMGKLDEAILILEKIYQSDKESDKVFASAPLGFAYAKKGEREKALKLIENLDGFSKNNYVPSQEKAIIFVGLGDFDKAFENLDKSCAEKFQSLPFLIYDPLVEDIRKDGRYQRIKNCVNL